MNEAGHQKAAEHRDRANKYRQTPFAPHVVPATESTEPKDSAYPKAIRCLDGAVRIADDEEHEEALMSQKTGEAVAQLEYVGEAKLADGSSLPVFHSGLPDPLFSAQPLPSTITKADLEEIRRMASAGEPLVDLSKHAEEIQNGATE